MFDLNHILNLFYQQYGKDHKSEEYLGNYFENGNWEPHLHFQVLLSLLNFKVDYPGVAYISEITVWKSICPNPNLLIKSEELEKKEN